MGKKLTLKQLQNYATSLGGKCLSPEYINIRTKIHWQCAKGHTWWAQFGGKSWCMPCRKKASDIAKRPMFYKELKDIAEKNNGELLSSEYIDMDTKLEWQCEFGHTWSAAPKGIRHGTWCRYCFGSGVDGRILRRVMTISMLEKMAIKNGGKLLSKTYTNSNKKYKWQCSCGFIWDAKFPSIENGHWCPRCGGVGEHSIEELNEHANKLGGRIVSTKYKGSRHKYIWECEKKHRWDSLYQAIRDGHWCPDCYLESVQPTIEDMQKLAEERGGKCLSEEYVLTTTKMKWECSNGHVFESSPNNLSVGSWCSECSSGWGERITRAYFEQLFGGKFERVHPKWLKIDGF